MVLLLQPSNQKKNSNSALIKNQEKTGTVGIVICDKEKRVSNNFNWWNCNETLEESQIRLQLLVLMH